MPWAIFADQEAVDLLDGAAEMAAAALAARSRRIDEDGVLKRSVDMSRIKLATLRSSFRSAPMIEFSEMDQADRETCKIIFRAMLTSPEEREHDALWKALRGLMLRPGPKEPFTLGADPWADEDLPKPNVPGCAESPSEKPSRVRGVQRKSRDGGAP